MRREIRSCNLKTSFLVSREGILQNNRRFRFNSKMTSRCSPTCMFSRHGAASTSRCVTRAPSVAAHQRWGRTGTSGAINGRGRRKPLKTMKMSVDGGRCVTPWRAETNYPLEIDGADSTWKRGSWGRLIGAGYKNMRGTTSSINFVSCTVVATTLLPLV